MGHPRNHLLTLILLECGTFNSIFVSSGLTLVVVPDCHYYASISPMSKWCTRFHFLK